MIRRRNKLCAVIGGGVVGLSVARTLAQDLTNTVLILEKNQHFGMEISSRNSEVIHAGIYYPTSSLKAKFCVQGKQLLYEYCQKFNIPFKRTGKLIVATSSSKKQLQRLKDIHQLAIQNGVHDLKHLNAEQVKVLEPEVQCVEALYSPSTGIIDSHSYMQALLMESEQHDTTISYNTEVLAGKFRNGRIQLDTLDTITGIPYELDCDIVVNCAGMDSLRLVQMFHPDQVIVQQPASFAKGSYFRLNTPRNNIFKHLIYPLPEESGLGIHSTLDLEGNVRFGPNVEWVSNSSDFQVSQEDASNFVESIRSYWPSLPDNALVADYAGIRPKLSGQDDTSFKDFLILDKRIHRIPGLIHLCGIESPGLTSSLAISNIVAQLLLSE